MLPSVPFDTLLPNLHDLLINAKNGIPGIWMLRQVDFLGMVRSQLSRQACWTEYTVSCMYVVYLFQGMFWVNIHAKVTS